MGLGGRHEVQSSNHGLCLIEDTGLQSRPTTDGGSSCNHTHCSRLKPRQRQPRPRHVSRLDYLHSHTRTIRPSTASPICLYAYFQRILRVVPTPLALAETRQRTLLATQTSTVATTQPPIGSQMTPRGPAPRPRAGGQEPGAGPRGRTRGHKKNY
jgi:hypothetical protein